MLTLGRMLDTELQMPNPGSSMGNRAKSMSRLGTKDGSAVSRSNNNLAHSMSRDELSAEAGGSLFKGGNNKSSLTGVGDLGGVDIDFHERAQNFEEAFHKIKSATGITNVDDLVNTFIKSEEHNFSLFNYVNEQNNEIEKYEEQIQTLKEEEMKYAQESGNDVNQHKEILRDLESKLQSSDLMAEKYELRCQDLQRITESLKRGMQTIFSKFEFSSEEGGAVEPTVTDTNLVHYLGLIEKKANVLLQNYSNVKQLLTAPAAAPHALLHGSDTVSLSSHDQAQHDLSATLVTVLGAGPKVPMGQDLMHINPPKADDYRSDDEDDDEDEDMRPLTRDELKNKTLSRMQRRIQGLGGGVGGGPNQATTANNATGGSAKKKVNLKK